MHAAKERLNVRDLPGPGLRQKSTHLEVIVNGTRESRDRGTSANLDGLSWSISSQSPKQAARVTCSDRPVRAQLLCLAICIYVTEYPNHLDQSECLRGIESPHAVLDVPTDEPASRITPYRPSRKIYQIRTDRRVRLQHLHFAILASQMRLMVCSLGLGHGKHQLSRSIDKGVNSKRNTARLKDGSRCQN